MAKLTVTPSGDGGTFTVPSAGHFSVATKDGRAVIEYQTADGDWVLHGHCPPLDANDALAGTQVIGYAPVDSAPFRWRKASSTTPTVCIEQ